MLFCLEFWGFEFHIIFAVLSNIKLCGWVDLAGLSNSSLECNIL